MQICVEVSFIRCVMLICSCLTLNSKVHEESVTLANPHLPLTAMKKTSPEAQAAPQEPAAKSAEQPAKRGEQEAESHSLCELRVSLEIHLNKISCVSPQTMMSPGLTSLSLPYQANRVQMLSASQQQNHQQVVQRRASPQKVSPGVLLYDCVCLFIITEIQSMTFY